MGFEFGKIKEDGKLTAFVLGAAAALAGAKAVKSQTFYKLCVKGLAGGMRAQNDAKVIFENMKEDAQDMYYDAVCEAGFAGDEESCCECGCEDEEC